MKRITLVVVLTVLACFFAVMVDESAAERPSGSGIKQNYSWTYTGDSTSVAVRDTQATIGGGSSKIFRFDDAKNYSTITGAYRIEYTGLDTGTAAADILDTAKDTIIVQFYTADEYFEVTNVVHTDTLVAFIFDTIGTGAWTSFDLSSAGVWANTYMTFISACADSSTGVARTTGGIDYKCTYKLWAK